MALKFTITKVTEVNLLVTLHFNLIDDANPLVIIDEGSIQLPVPDGLSEDLLRGVIATESIKRIQDWFNTWKALSAEVAVNNARRAALSKYINANIIL